MLESEDHPNAQGYFEDEAHNYQRKMNVEYMKATAAMFSLMNCLGYLAPPLSLYPLGFRS